ncbi:MAG TPA: leucine zipper domain-containing protein, partial [Solirubrobacterales bacterium]
MKTHPRAKLGPAARQELCELIEAGMTIRGAARAFRVSPATAHKWWHRHREGGPDALADRSSRPHRCPRELPRFEQARIC